MLVHKRLEGCKFVWPTIADGVMYNATIRMRARIAARKGAPSGWSAASWAMLASIVATCKLNDVNPAAYIAETLEAIHRRPSP